MNSRTTTFKATAALCAVLAGTLGFGSIASAQDWGRHGGDQRGEQQQHQQQQRRDGDRQDWRHGHREQPRYVAQQHDRRWDGGQRAYGGAPRFARGGYLPYEYRARGYYVNDWRAYNGLYAPPYGQQWVNVDGQFLLVALASGLIANALLN